MEDDRLCISITARQGKPAARDSHASGQDRSGQKWGIHKDKTKTNTQENTKKGRENKSRQIIN